MRMANGSSPTGRGPIVPEPVWLGSNGLGLLGRPGPIGLGPSGPRLLGRGLIGLEPIGPRLIGRGLSGLPLGLLIGPRPRPIGPSGPSGSGAPGSLGPLGVLGPASRKSLKGPKLEGCKQDFPTQDLQKGSF